MCDVTFLSDDVVVIAYSWQAAFFCINDVALMSHTIYPSVEAKCSLGASKEATLKFNIFGLGE